MTNSRPQKRLNRTWRRRQCDVCRAVFTTIEQAALADGLMVSPKMDQKQLQPFERDTLFVSIFTSCQHRPNAVQDTTALTDTILGRLSDYSDGAIIDRAELRNTVLAVLKRFDNAAAVHYAAFHT
ncbi:MAG TPA: hypothetical protein VFL85_00530 [Candidatus Saccharimonadales bacterium]|nr:hypothetical protein [Candidatus Saccharimonadales bacterium]